MSETKATKIKIARGRRPTPEQLRQALMLARQRQDDKIVLMSPETNEVWATATTNAVEDYLRKIDAIEWPFAGNKRRTKVVIE